MTKDKKPTKQATAEKKEPVKDESMKKVLDKTREKMAKGIDARTALIQALEENGKGGMTRDKREDLLLKILKRRATSET